MNADALQSLLLELFAAIQLVSTYPQPAHVPQVHVLSRAAMQAKICSRPCPVRAFYHSEWGVHIDESLDVFNDAFDRSILLHELVHHLQRVSGKFETAPGDCYRRHAEELEAYEIQNRYLARQGSTRRALTIGVAHMCANR